MSENADHPRRFDPAMERVYAALVDEEDARACRDISEDACRVVPRAFLANTTAQAMTGFGDAIINPKTTLPWLLTSLGAPGWAAGLLVPLREAGSLLPQLAIAGWLRTLPRRKFAWMVGAGLQGASVLAIAGAALGLEGQAFALALLALVTVFSLSRGICSVAAKDVLGKTVAKSRRGRVSGYASAVAGAGTLVLALALWLLGDPERMPYVPMLLLGGALWLAAIPVYHLIPEYPGATEGGANGLREAIRRMRVVVEDAPFRRFLLVRFLLISTALIGPFVVVLARERTDLTLAYFLFAQGAASLVAGPIWGRLSDLSSRHVLIVAASGAAAVGGATSAVAWLHPTLLSSPWLLPVVFLAIAVLHDGVRLGRKTHVVDLAGGNRRTDYVAVGNTLTGIALLAVGALLALVPLAAVGKILLLTAVTAIGAALATTLSDVQA
ncbi:MAG: MFS transporter [Pseudomonadota bacterium]